MWSEEGAMHPILEGFCGQVVADDAGAPGASSASRSPATNA